MNHQYDAENEAHRLLDEVEQHVERRDYPAASPVMKEAIRAIGGIANPIAHANAINRQVRLAERLTDVWLNG